MAVKIRLMRVGKKKQPTLPRRRRRRPFARATAGSSRSSASTRRARSRRSSASTPSGAVHWLRKGAQPTEQVAKLLEITGVWDAYKDATGKDAAAKPAPRTPQGEDAEAGRRSTGARAGARAGAAAASRGRARGRRAARPTSAAADEPPTRRRRPNDATTT